MAYRTFMNFQITTQHILEESIPKAFQSGADDFSDEGFGSDTPLMILAKIKQAYGKTRVKEITGQIKRLLDPFGRNRTIEELIREIEDVQMFLMAIPLADRKLPEITLIDYAIMILKTAGIYGKAIERWTVIVNRLGSVKKTLQVGILQNAKTRRC